MQHARAQGYRVLEFYHHLGYCDEDITLIERLDAVAGTDRSERRYRRRHMSEDQLARVRRICAALPATSERISHGEPTFFVNKKVFVMFANNHHNDGRIAVWLAGPPGFQAGMLESAPEIFFRPPYVGARGWIGIILDRISDADLTMYIQIAWELIAPKRVRAERERPQD